MKQQEDQLNLISQNLKNFGKEEEYRRQFPDFNDTINNKIRESTPFRKNVDSGRYGITGDKNQC